MTLFDTFRRFLHCISRDNVRKGLALLRRGDLGVLRSAVKNLIDQREALEPLVHAAPLVHAVRFQPTAHDDGEPFVSVVIPCFNYGAFVEEAVRSALNQTYRNIEVLVVDGGSTDASTRDVVGSLAGERVRVFLRDQRHLAGSNRNFGIEQARAPYIICLDADDTLAPTFIEKALFLTEHCGFDVVSTGLSQFGAKSGKVGIMLAPQLRDMLSGNHVYTCALFRRSMWREVGGYHDYGIGQDHAAEDWDFWIRLSAAGARICNIAGEHLLNYRAHANGSLSSDQFVPDVTRQRQRILSRLGDVGSPAALERSSQVSAEIRIVANSQTLLSRAMMSHPPVDGRPCILIVMPFFLIGGAERLLLRVVEELQRAGWRVVVLSTVAQAGEETDAIGWFQALTPEVYALPRFVQPRYWHTFIDYLLSSRPFTGVLIAGSRLFYDILPALKSGHPELKIVDFLFNVEGHTEPHARLRHHFEGVLCENTEVEAWCLAQGWSAADVVMVESRIATSSYRAGSRPTGLADQLGIMDKDIVIGWSGRLSEEKSPETFVEVARLCAGLTDVVFVMTGGGRLQSSITASVNRLAPGTRFHLRGVVEDVSDYFELYDICLIPSLIDGRPIAALEALASGCVLIASGVGGLPQLIRDGETGFITPAADAIAMVQHIRTLHADRWRLSAMQQAARRFAQEHLDNVGTDLPYQRAVSRLMARKGEQGMHI